MRQSREVSGRRRETRDDATRIVGPSSFWLDRNVLVEIDGGGLAGGHASHSDESRSIGRGGNLGVAVDGHGEDEAAVLVGMFADEVDAAWCAGDPAWWARVDILKFAFNGHRTYGNRQ